MGFRFDQDNQNFQNVDGKFHLHAANEEEGSEGPFFALTNLDMSDKQQGENDDYKIGDERIIAASQNRRGIVLTITIFFLELRVVLFPQGLHRKAGEKKRETDGNCTCGDDKHQYVVNAIVDKQTSMATAQDSSVEE